MTDNCFLFCRANDENIVTYLLILYLLTGDVRRLLNTYVPYKYYY